MQIGHYENLSADSYHADSAVGSSGLKAFSECPALYEYEYLNPDRAKERASKYLSIGSHAHIALLEPHIFKEDYAIAPEMAITNRGKKNEDKKPMNKTHGDWTAFESGALLAGKKAILYSEHQQAIVMSEVIKRHDLANAMLTGGKAEMSFFAKDEETGEMVKARPDYLVNIPNIGVVLVDYKTSSVNMKTSKQSVQAFGLGRHIQAAHHKTVTEAATGGKINEVVYITQSQEAPHLIRIFRMPEEGLRLGAEQCRVQLRGIAECRARGMWPDYPHIIEDYIVPHWLQNDYN